MTNHGRNNSIQIHHGHTNGRSNREVVDDVASNNNHNIITELLPSDILCGKDKTYGKHPGNQVYRRLIEDRAIAYANTNMSKQIKMGVTKEIVAQLTTAGARFLRKRIDLVGEAWEEISNQQARDKTSHALRFCAKYHGTQKKRPLLLVPSSTSSTTANPTTTTKHHHQHHRRMVSSETLGSMDHQQGHENAIAIFQRQQAILNQSLNGHQHRPSRYGRQYSSGSKAVWEQPRGGCDEEQDEEDDLALLHHQPQQRHRHHHEDSKPDGVVSSSRDLADILQEPLHESMNEDGDWDGYFIQPSASS
jgi:hypothetical protein